MKRLKPLFLVPLTLLLTYCASTKPEPQYFEDGIVNLAGMWVSNNKNPNALDVLLGIDINEKSSEVYIMGEKAKSYHIMTRGNQFLISYETMAGQKFNVLAQMKNRNEMRITRTAEAVQSFMPVGQLGERVFHLRRIDSKQALMASSNTKKE